MFKHILLTILMVATIPLFLSAQADLQAGDNTLTITYLGEADSVFWDIKGYELIKLSEVKKGYWEKSMTIEHIDELILQYRINSFSKEIEKSGVYELWTGKKLPPFYSKKGSIDGQLIHEETWSKSLGEERKLSIYLPQNYRREKSYPIVYCTDGAIVKEYAPFIEQLIDDKKITEIILVGIHPGETPEVDKMDISKNKRTLEYLRGISKFLPQADTNRYARHLTFFCEEMLDSIESRYLEIKEQRSLFGFSNGASFSVSAALQYPDLYANVIALSIGWEMAFDKAVIKDDFPKFYLAAGSLEKDFFTITQKWADLLREKDKEVVFEKAVSFHDDVMWREAFLNALVKIYGSKQ